MIVKILRKYDGDIRYEVYKMAIGDRLKLMSKRTAVTNIEKNKVRRARNDNQRHLRLIYYVIIITGYYLNTGKHKA